MKSLKPNRVRIGAIAGFIAVIGTTFLNLLGRAIGWLPESMYLRHMAELFIDLINNPSGALISGIVVHIIEGTIVGIVYVYFIKSIGIRTGVLFMLCFWLFMMVIGMPISGRALFGLSDGLIMPAATLTLNLVFGAAMGLVAKKLQQNNE
jgi:hypothetical protein